MSVSVDPFKNKIIARSIKNSQDSFNLSDGQIFVFTVKCVLPNNQVSTFQFTMIISSASCVIGAPVVKT